MPNVPAIMRYVFRRAFYHLEQVNEQLKREPLPAPQLWLNPDIKDITQFTMADIRLENYQCHEAITAPMAV